MAQELKKMYNIRLDKKLLKDIGKEGKKAGRKLPDQIRWILNQWLKNKGRKGS